MAAVSACLWRTAALVTGPPARTPGGAAPDRNCSKGSTKMAAATPEQDATSQADTTVWAAGRTEMTVRVWVRIKEQFQHAGMLAYVTLHHEMSCNVPDGHFHVFIFSESKFYVIYNGENQFQIRLLLAELHVFEYGGTTFGTFEKTCFRC